MTFYKKKKSGKKYIFGMRVKTDYKSQFLFQIFEGSQTEKTPINLWDIAQNRLLTSTDS